MADSNAQHATHHTRTALQRAAVVFLGCVKLVVVQRVYSVVWLIAAVLKDSAAWHL